MNNTCPNCGISPVMCKCCGEILSEFPIVGTFEYDLKNQKETYTPNPNYPHPVPDASQPAAFTNLEIIHKGIEFTKTLNADNESYLSGAAFGYSCGYQAASQPAGNDAAEPQV